MGGNGDVIIPVLGAFGMCPRKGVGGAVVVLEGGGKDKLEGYQEVAEGVGLVSGFGSGA